MRAPRNRLRVRALSSRLYKMRFFIDGKTMADSKGSPPNWQGIGSSKIQSPNPREAPIPKLQNPASNAQARLELGAWCLELLWSLALGNWSFYPAWRQSASTSAKS